jgi:hypothetical protein
VHDDIFSTVPLRETDLDTTFSQHAPNQALWQQLVMTGYERHQSLHNVDPCNPVQLPSDMDRAGPDLRHVPSPRHEQIDILLTEVVGPPNASVLPSVTSSAVGDTRNSFGYNFRCCSTRFGNFGDIRNNFGCCSNTEARKHTIEGYLEEFNPALLATLANKEDHSTWEEAMNEPLSIGCWKAAQTEINMLNELDV